MGSWMQVYPHRSRTDESRQAPRRTATQSHADDLVPRRDGAHHAVDRFPRVGLQAPSLCAHVQYSSGAPSASVLYVPASCMLYVPEALGSLPPGRGSAVRTAYHVPWHHRCPPRRPRRLTPRAPPRPRTGCRATRHGRSAPLIAPELGSCGSSGRAWRLWAARHSQR